MLGAGLLALLAVPTSTNAQLPPKRGLDIDLSRILDDMLQPKLELGPFPVSGFRYQRGNGGFHLNVCRAATCGFGSSVNYALSAPDPAPSLASFRAERAHFAASLKFRQAYGVIIEIEPAEEKREGPYTIFRERRRESFSPKVEYKLSQRVHTQHATITLESSADDPQLLEDNAQAFLVPILLAVEKLGTSSPAAPLSLAGRPANPAQPRPKP